MCGILGSIGQFNNINEESFNHALQKSNFRGPDFSNSHNFISCNMWLGQGAMLSRLNSRRRARVRNDLS